MSRLAPITEPAIGVACAARASGAAEHAHLVSWAVEGFPLVRLTDEAALDMSNTDPPPDWLLLRGSNVDEHTSLAIEVGTAFLLFVRDWRGGDGIMMLPNHGPEHEAELLSLHERILSSPTEQAEAILAQKRLITNVGFALLERPEGLDIREHRPSAKAMRKQGRKHYPTVQYIIQAARDLHPPPRDEERGHREEGWTQSVRTLVRGHWRQQPYGPGNSLRKVIWVRPFWRGPEDAPISIHPMRVTAERQQ